MITSRDLRTNPFFRSSRVGPLRRDATLTGHQFLAAGESARKLRLTVDVDGSAPAWLEPALARLQEISRLQNNWNSYGAPATDVQSITRTIDVMNDLMMEHDRLMPVITPTKNGGIQLAFEAASEVLEIIVSRDRVDVAYEDMERGVDWERPLQESRDEVRSILQRIST